MPKGGTEKFWWSQGSQIVLKPGKELRLKKTCLSVSLPSSACVSECSLATDLRIDALFSTSRAFLTQLINLDLLGKLCFVRF